MDESDKSILVEITCTICFVPIAHRHCPAYVGAVRILWGRISLGNRTESRDNGDIAGNLAGIHEY